MDKYDKITAGIILTGGLLNFYSGLEKKVSDTPCPFHQSKPYSTKHYQTYLK